MRRAGLSLLPTAFFLLMQMPTHAVAGGVRDIEKRIADAVDALERGAGARTVSVDAVVLDHPLFVPGRAAALENRPTPLPDDKGSSSAIDLHGIVREGKRVFALVTVPGAENASFQRIEEGDVVGGWRVRKIQPDRIVLDDGKTQKTLLLYSYPPVRTAHRRAHRRLPHRHPTMGRMNRQHPPGNHGGKP